MRHQIWVQNITKTDIKLFSGIQIQSIVTLIEHELFILALVQCSGLMFRKLYLFGPSLGGRVYSIVTQGMKHFNRDPVYIQGTFIGEHTFRLHFWVPFPSDILCTHLLVSTLSNKLYWYMLAKHCKQPTFDVSHFEKVREY